MDTHVPSVVSIVILRFPSLRYRGRWRPRRRGERHEVTGASSLNELQCWKIELCQLSRSIGLKQDGRDWESDNENERGGLLLCVYMLSGWGFVASGTSTAPPCGRWQCPDVTIPKAMYSSTITCNNHLSISYHVQDFSLSVVSSRHTYTNIFDSTFAVTWISFEKTIKSGPHASMLCKTNRQYQKRYLDDLLLDVRIDFSTSWEPIILF